VLSAGLGVRGASGRASCSIRCVPTSPADLAAGWRCGADARSAGLRQAEAERWRQPAPSAALIKERHNPAVQRTAPDDIVKLRHRCDQVPATTFGYGNRTMSAVRWNGS
jgi:hypothetical protein